jgi:hypothetical protein
MKSFDQQVADWARTKPADETYSYVSCTECALAQFLTEAGIAKRPNVGGDDWGDLGSHQPRQPISAKLAAALHDGERTFGALAERLSS